MEQVLKRTERTWIARLVAGSAPELVATETDYLLTIGSSQPAFLVLTSPLAFGIAQPAQVVALAAKARREHRAAFQIGRAIVLAFNGAWESPTLVEDLVTLLVRHQLGGPVPSLLPRSRVGRALRALQAWIRTLLAAAAGEDAAAERVPVELPAPTATAAGVSAAGVSEPVGTLAWDGGKDVA